MPSKLALRRLLDRVAAAASLQAVYDGALDCLRETLDVERAAVLVLDDGGVMRFTAWTGLSAGYRRAVEGHSPWPADAQDPQPVLVEDVAHDLGQDTLRPVIERERIRALAFIPLCFGRRLLGTFMLYHEQPHRFTQDELTVAEMVAGYVAFALEHRRIATELESRFGAEHAARGDAEREAALRAAHERRLQLALAAGAMGTWDWDIASGRVDWSEQLEAIHGIDPGSFGGTFADFAQDIHPEDREHVRETLDRAVRDGGDYDLEYRILPEDGLIRWLSAKGRLLRDDQGRPARMVGICSDVSERKRLQQAESFLAQASRVLATTFEPAQTIRQLASLVVPRLADWCIVFALRDGRAVPVEVAHRDPVKVGLARAIADEWSGPAEPGPLVAAIRLGHATVTPRIDAELLAAGAPAESLEKVEPLGLHSAVTAPLKARGRVLGAVMLISAESKHVYSEADLRLASEIASWAALALDNAELYAQARRARGAAERAGRRLELLARISNDLATSLDPEQALQRLAEHAVPELADYCITYACEGGAVRRLGFAHGDPAKLPLVQALAATGPPKLDDAAGAGAVIRTGRDILAEEIDAQMLERSGLSPAHLEAVRALEPRSTIIVALRARGATLGAIALVTTADSERRYGADELNLARELASRAALLIDNARLFARANAAVRARDEMIAVVSHELRSPLQSITTAAAMLELDASPETLVKSTDTIALANAQIDRLLTDLLDISRIDAGRLAIDPEDTQVAALLDEAEALFRPLAARKGVRFVANADDGLPQIRVDRGRILQVLGNLLGNALKFVTADGRIELSATLREDGSVRLAVSDDGAGIARENLDRVFERFWRGGREGHGGAGLGLALAKGIVEAHGGLIGVDSRAGEGSTFYVVLEASGAVERLGPGRAEQPARVRPAAHGARTRTG